jgi:hypothetical protein
MSGIEIHNFNGSRHDHSVPTLKPLHSRNIIESDVKHHNTNLNLVLAINYFGMKHSVYNLMAYRIG